MEESLVLSRLLAILAHDLVVFEQDPVVVWWEGEWMIAEECTHGDYSKPHICNKYMKISKYMNQGSSNKVNSYTHISFGESSEPAEVYTGG